MARPDITHILVRDSDGVVTNMRGSAWAAEDIPADHTQYTPDTTDYDHGPVMYDVGLNKLLPRMDDAGSDPGYKAQMKDKIDAITSYRIVNDTFTYNGKQFSCSTNAQVKWAGIVASINSGRRDASVSEVKAKTKDNSSVETLDTNDKVLDAYDALVAVVESHLEAGDTAVEAIDAASDKAAVDAIVAAY